MRKKKEHQGGISFLFCFLTSEMSVHENIFSSEKGGGGNKNIKTHDFSTPTEWNVEMVQNKVIVTLKGGGEKNDTDTSGMCGSA